MGGAWVSNKNEELHIGSILAIRNFVAHEDLTGNPRLTSLNTFGGGAHYFNKGVNFARCTVNENLRYSHGRLCRCSSCLNYFADLTTTYKMGYSTPRKMSYSPHKEEKSAGHEIPGIDCKCGFYSRKIGVNEYNAPKTVLAIVRLSGRVIEGTKGYRSERLEIIGILGRRRKRDKKYAKAYGVEYIPGWKSRFDTIEDIFKY